MKLDEIRERLNYPWPFAEVADVRYLLSEVDNLKKENKLLRAIAEKAEEYTGNYSCKLKLTSSMTVPSKNHEDKLNGTVELKKLTETHFDGLGELKQALKAWRER